MGQIPEKQGREEGKKEYIQDGGRGEGEREKVEEERQKT